MPYSLDRGQVTPFTNAVTGKASHSTRVALYKGTLLIVASSKQTAGAWQGAGSGGEEVASPTRLAHLRATQKHNLPTMDSFKLFRNFCL